MAFRILESIESRLALVASALLCTTLACAPSGNPDEDEEERRGRTDPCVADDRYDDGVCDRDCLNYDEDCDAEGGRDGDGDGSSGDGDGSSGDGDGSSGDGDGSSGDGDGSSGDGDGSSGDGDGDGSSGDGDGSSGDGDGDGSSGDGDGDGSSGDGDGDGDVAPTVPAAWTCEAMWYGDNACDCGCGALDTDCPDAAATSCEYKICPAGQEPMPNQNWQCEVSETTPAVPAGWICGATWYGDGTCDCGCGAIDSDCPDAAASSCGWNNCPSGQEPVANQNWQCQASTGGTPPPNTSPDNSCQNRCGQAAPGGCYCDTGCVNAGDCCVDYASFCGG